MGKTDLALDFLYEFDDPGWHFLSTVTSYTTSTDATGVTSYTYTYIKDSFGTMPNFGIRFKAQIANSAGAVIVSGEKEVQIVSQ